MKLSTKSRYAMRAMLFLAAMEQEGPQPLSRMAETGLPADYLEQLLGRLRRSGLVRSVRGKQGGYLLAKPAGDITLLQVIDAVEGMNRMNLCACDETTCESRASCGLQSAWDKVTEGLFDLMASYNLKDMLNPPAFEAGKGGQA